MKVATVVGARPQFIKASVLARAARAVDNLHHVVVHTGQHSTPLMSDRFFEEFDMPSPEHHLGITGGRHGEMTGRMIIAVEQALLAESPDVVVVVGDTNSTLAAALAGAKLNIPVAHVEAGLRSFNRRMPEEVNRVVTDHLSSLLFCPTRTAVTNLRAEGISEGVHLVGDVMFDAALDAAVKARMTSTILADLRLRDRGYAVATVHRAENTDDPSRLAAVLAYLQAEADDPIVLPLHPRTQAAVDRWRLSLDRLCVVPPLGYFDMTRLVLGASRVYTDSGGLQKEAYFHRVPCITLREETEWVETIDHGWNRLWSVGSYRTRSEIPEYGDGTAGQGIVKVLLSLGTGVSR